ncbi:MAG: HSP20 family protein [Chlamydiales bacterium]|jgi:HSP20 family protein
MNWFNESRIQRWDPLGLMPLARGAEGLLSGPIGIPAGPGSPRANVHVDEGRVLVRVELPGFGPDDVQVSLEGRTLRVRGEVGAPKEDSDSARSFERGFRMPFPIANTGNSEGSDQGVEARLEHGVLEVRLTRAEADRPRRIPIGSGNEDSSGGSL